MDPTTIPEKLRAPALPPSYLRRPRLDRLWQDRAAHRLLLVTAGAGYGKSSFLAQQARDETRAVFWYRVDEADAQPSAFAGHLLGLLGVPASGPGGAQTDPPEQRVLPALLSAIRARGPSLLVLDDAHLLEPSRNMLRLLEMLIRYLPETATLVLSSREPLPVGGARARTSGLAASLDARDLAFRADEVAALFALRHGAAIRPTHCRRILAATEGWAAGLEIFLQTLESPLPTAIDRAIARLAAAGSGWFDFFAEEVVARLDAGTQEFLYRSAVLPRLVPAMCDAVLERRDSRPVLEDLVRRNLFTLRESAEPESYRYHYVFHRFLRDRLSRRVTADDLARLRHLAAGALMERGSIADAIEIFAESGDAKAAIALLSEHGDALLATGRGASVARALASIGPERVRTNAAALYLQARLDDDAGRWVEAEENYRRALEMRPGPARRVETFGWLGEIASRRGEYARAVALCRKGLRERKRGSALAVSRLLWTLGVSECELGRLETGLKYLEEARALCARRGDIFGQAQVEYLIVANVHLPRGRFDLARETARHALARLRSLGMSRRVPVALGVLAWVEAVEGDTPEARDHATEALRLAEELDLPLTISLAHHVLGRCCLLDGEIARARSHLEESRRIGDLIGESDARILPRILLGECALAAGERGAARRLGEEALAIAREMKDVLQEAEAVALLGLVHSGNDRRASRLHWSRAERVFRRLDASFLLHRLLLQRLAEEEMTEPARKRLTRELLSGAARHGHERLFLVVEPARAARVLARALADDIEPEQAAGLLARLGQRVVPELLPLSRDTDDRVRLRAVALLAQLGGPAARGALTRMARAEPERESAQKADSELARAPVEPLHIETLGAFRVRAGETDLRADQWRSARARRLFQLLLIHQPRWVAQDEVMEALWPEADPEKARNNLAQSVYQLRRILEPGLKELRASRYVRVAETGYRLEPGEGHTCDAVEFEEAVRKADRLAASGRPRTAEPLYRRALELYRGEFLAESPYEEFLVPRREQLRELLLRASARLVAICVEAKRWADALPLCRRALRDDPYNELMHFHLVQAQIQLGHHREALEAYQQFEERFVRELGAPRTPRMQELAERIRRGGR